MSNCRKPYVRYKNRDNFIIIFNLQNIMFIDKIIDYCNNHNIHFRHIQRNDTSKFRYKIDGNHTDVTNLKLWIKQTYDEFHYYNREIQKIIKDQHPLLKAIIKL